MSLLDASEALIVHYRGDLDEATRMASAAGANLGDLECDDAIILGITVLRACTDDGIWALKTLLETGHATHASELYHSPTLPHPARLDG